METLNLWELTLPVEEVHRRWHHGGNPHLYLLTHRDVGIGRRFKVRTEKFQMIVSVVSGLVLSLFFCPF